MTGSSQRSSTDHFYAILTALLFLLISVGSADAQTEIPWREVIWEDDFSAYDASRYYVGVSSYHDPAGQDLVLTPGAIGQTGRLFLPQLLPIDYCDVSFRARFGYNGTTNSGGADGIVFVLGALYDYAPTGGGQLNFDGCLGYGVEFDTYENGDRSDPHPEHIAVIKERTDNHLHSETLVVPTLEDNGWHRILIRFRGGRVHVFLDNVSRFDHTIANFFPFDGFYGFVSATGTSFNEHRIDDIRLSLPTRSAMNFGSVSLCEPFALDTSLFVRNNHPDNMALTITAVRLQGGTPGIFTVQGFSVPSVIPPGGRIEVPLQVRLSTPGSYTAILELEADNGERILDTLRITGVLPELTWAPPLLDFGYIWLEDTASTRIALVNTGDVDVTVTRLRWMSGGGYVFSYSAVTPALLAPGDSLSVTIDFMPSGNTALVWDSLFADTDCRITEGMRVQGQGDDERVVVSVTPLLLFPPGESGAFEVRLEELPSRYAVREISGRIAFDDSFVEILDAARNENLLPVASGLVVNIQQDYADVLLTRPDRFDQTGVLFTLLLGARTPGPECRDILLTDLQTDLGGINEGDVGRVCINPSCRHPEGLYALASPQLQVYPHPVVCESSIRLTLEQTESLTLRLLDLFGKELRVLYRGQLTQGEHRIPMDHAELSDGLYFIRAEWSGGMKDHPVVINR